MRSTAVIVI
jgi:hypothetical protein